MPSGGPHPRHRSSLQPPRRMSSRQPSGIKPRRHSRAAAGHQVCRLGRIVRRQHGLRTPRPPLLLATLRPIRNYGTLSHQSWPRPCSMQWERGLGRLRTLCAAMVVSLPCCRECSASFQLNSATCCRKQALRGRLCRRWEGEEIGPPVGLCKRRLRRCQRYQGSIQHLLDHCYGPALATET
jgi:hypothetical protein